MGSSKFRLSEEILLVLSGGRIGTGTKFDPNEIKISICQVANKLLKMEYMQTNLPMGEMIPGGSTICTYDNLPAYKYKNVSAITLPTAPLRLPRDMGCWSIFPTDNPNAAFIPLQDGDANMLQSESLVSQLAGNIGYERYGLIVQFDEDITIPNQVVPITARLVVLDFNQYDDYTPLPLSADHEWDIKKEVIAMYSQEPTADKLVDSGVKEQRIPIKEQMQP